MPKLHLVRLMRERIARLGNKAASAVSALMPLVDGDSDYLRYLTAETIGAIKPPVDKARPLLEKLQNDPNPIVRASAEEVLKNIGNY